MSVVSRYGHTVQPTKETKDDRRPDKRQPDKRRAILAGALELFGRDGYTRASLDAIAAASGVSSRTIYNHFKDKAELFQAVIQESTHRVAEMQIDLIDRYLGKIVDLEADLIEFGVAWQSKWLSRTAPHLALVRQIHAEAEHIPRAAADAWWQEGPSRVRRVLADRLRVIADRGLLRVADPDRAALHLMLLLSVENLTTRSARVDGAEIDDAVAAGVHAFLHGYRS
jgi:AcrR family transcriptional regulator